jgi:hypothetical protein
MQADGAIRSCVNAMGPIINPTLTNQMCGIVDLTGKSTRTTYIYQY